jgi:hypothetical protein
MDYTTLVQVLGIIGDGKDPSTRPNPAPYDDTVIGIAITAASRSIDRMVTGSSTADSDSYFGNSTLTAEILKGNVNRDGDIQVHLHKPSCSVPTAMAYRYRGNEDWTTISTSLITVDNYLATAWIGSLERGQVQVKATYTGGLGAAQTNLPADIQRAAAILAARYYKEGKAGLTDVIGVADVGTMVYTKAVPVEVERILDPYTRPVPW